MPRRTPYVLLALAVLILVLGPIGTSAYVLGFVYGESPCVLCWAQRTGMILVALCGLFVLRYGARPRYLGLSILVAAWGVYAGLRHSALHLARDVGQGFSGEILGAHTYTWSMFIFWVCVLMIGILVMLLRDGEAAATQRPPSALDRLAMPLFLIAVAGNLVQAFASTGPPPYMGQSDPVRFSFNPRHWVWSLEEWSPAPVSLRGRWAIEKPGLDRLDPDPAAGPLAGVGTLPVRRRTQVTLPLDGRITDVAYDEASRRFLLTTDHGVHIASDDLTHVGRRTVIDPEFSVDLSRFAGAAFLDAQTVMAVGENKSYVVLRETGHADAAKNFRFFRESFDAFDEQARGRFATVRARMMYVMSAAYSGTTNSIYTVSVPNARVHRLVVSRFDRRDMTLSEEFLPELPRDGTLRPGAGRSIDEYYVTGAAVAGSRLYAISAAYSTLLAIDLTSRALVGAYTVAGLQRPVGLALRGNEVHIAGDTGTWTVVDRPAEPGVP